MAGCQPTGEKRLSTFIFRGKEFSDRKKVVLLLEAGFDSPCWYAVYTRANREKQVAAHLENRGVLNFLPQYETVRQWSDRRVRLQRPLFPGYLFVHTTLRNRLPILQAPGVVRLVGSGDNPLPLDSGQVEALRDGLASVAAEPYPYLPTGQRVRVVSGPLNGIEGVLLRRKSGARVVISIDLIQRSFVVGIDADSLVPIDRASR